VDWGGDRGILYLECARAKLKVDVEDAEGHEIPNIDFDI
jgi:hypothetical protein